MDVDGTMTDGSVALLSQPDGTALEIKTFDAHDGQGLTLAHTAGLRTGLHHGPRKLRAGAARPRDENGIHLPEAAAEVPALEEIMQKAGVHGIGRRLCWRRSTDFADLRRVGLAIAVGDAVPQVKQAAHYVAKAHAGKGAIREAVELILKSKGIWKK